MKVRLAVVTGLLLAAAAPADQSQPLSLSLQGLRSAKGQVLVCITRQARYFPDCSDDPERRHMTVPATEQATFLGSLPPGEYGLAVIHDENGNGKLDTFAGIPREGVGFSRNPPIRFGAPSFRSALFAVSGSAVRQEVKVKYFL
ncbi:putative uncharacterized protein precursor [Sphingomonas paucimobilis]|nr:putative uncharacterized protein precursor [Sphingomonas paucimobilis]